MTPVPLPQLCTAATDRVGVSRHPQAQRRQREFDEERVGQRGVNVEAAWSGHHVEPGVHREQHAGNQRELLQQQPRAPHRGDAHSEQRDELGHVIADPGVTVVRGALVRGQMHC